MQSLADKIVDLYSKIITVEKRMSRAAIAKEVGCTPSYVQKVLVQRGMIKVNKK